MLEQLLVELVPRYLAARERLGLREALWGYWIAKESPLSVDLPIFAAALEGLKKKWLASSESQSRGLHVTRETFDRVAGDLIAELRTRVQKQGLPEEIERTVVGANRMGLGAQMKAFLREIDLPIGEREKAAMKARHLSAHGATAGDEVTELVRLSNAYRTLFDRVFLRLLGYTGEYVDRTTEGHPSRPLRTPAGGEAAQKMRQS